MRKLLVRKKLEEVLPVRLTDGLKDKVEIMSAFHDVSKAEIMREGADVLWKKFAAEHPKEAAKLKDK